MKKRALDKAKKASRNERRKQKKHLHEAKYQG